MVKINTAISGAITSITKANEARDKATTKPLDTLWAEGARSADFKSPAKGLDRAFYNQAKLDVVAGFAVVERKLLATDTKNLSEDSKALKKKIQQKIGARMGDIARLLKAREPKATKAPNGQTSQAAPSAPSVSAENTGSPIKSHIERLTTLPRDLLNLKPSQLSETKRKALEKLVGDLIEGLNEIK